MGRRRAGLSLAALLAAGCAAPQGARTSDPRADRAEVVAMYERATRQGVDAYARLFDFAEVGALERLLQRYDLYRGDPLGEPEEVRRAAPPEPFAVERERRNLIHLFPLLAGRVVGGGGCREVPVRGWYARHIASYEPLPAEDTRLWGPLRDRVLGTLRCGGTVGLSCERGEGAIVVAYARLPCTPDGPAPGASLKVITVYVDDPSDTGP